MKEFYNVLVRKGLGEREEMYKYAKKHIEKHTIRVVSTLLEQAPKGTLLFLATLGGSAAAKAAQDHFGINFAISNTDLFTNNKLSGIEINIKNGDEKLLAVLNELQKHDVCIERCTVIGDSDVDVPLLKVAGHRIASPLANEQVRGINGIIQLHS